MDLVAALAVYDDPDLREPVRLELVYFRFNGSAAPLRYLERYLDALKMNNRVQFWAELIPEETPNKPGCLIGKHNSSVFGSLAVVRSDGGAELRILFASQAHQVQPLFSYPDGLPVGCGFCLLVPRHSVFSLEWMLPQDYHYCVIIPFVDSPFSTTWLARVVLSVMRSSHAGCQS